MTCVLLAALVLQADVPQPVAPDSAALRRFARRAEATFERATRDRAPVTFATFRGQCDEVIGRFCLSYDAAVLPEPAPESPAITRARRAAIEALRQAFSVAPGELDVAAPLVRYLVEDERASEAVSTARAFHALTADSTWGALLLGFALHGADSTAAAERWFAHGMQGLDESERERIEDVQWLLSDEELRAWRRMTAEQRTAYAHAFWTLADPLYLTPGNERRTEHLARHVWSRILSRAPVVRDAVSWGRDLEQITVRYGTPRSRLRSLGVRPGQSSMIDRFERNQLAYAVEDLHVRGVPPAPLPGEEWPLANTRARSGHAPGTIRRMAPLEHQVSRFPDGDEVVVRVDARVALDSLAAGADSVRAGLFVLDSLHRHTRAELRTITAVGDTVAVQFQTRLPAGRYVYSVELFEPATQYAARARYSLERLAAGAQPRLSDVVVAAPFAADGVPLARTDDALRPHASLVLDAGTPVGLFAEVSGLRAGVDGHASFAVEVTLHSADRGSLPGDIVRWLGRRLGLASEPVPPRVSWTATGTAHEVNAIAVDVMLDDVAAGLYVFEVAVTDLVSGDRAESRRPVRVE